MRKDEESTGANIGQYVISHVGFFCFIIMTIIVVLVIKGNLKLWYFAKYLLLDCVSLGSLKPHSLISIVLLKLARGGMPKVFIPCLYVIIPQD